MEPKTPRFCYIEIPALDPERSADFYASVFGWNIRHRGSGRPSFDDAGIISGAWVGGRPPARDPGLLPYVWVDDIDQTLAKVIANGGSIVEAKRLNEEPDGEWMATFHDPAGNLIGLPEPRPR